MACCLYFFQGSRTWLALLVPIFAVFASFSSLISITLCILLIFIFSKQKPILVLKEATDHEIEEKQEKTLISTCSDHSSSLFLAQAETNIATKAQRDEDSEEGNNFLVMRSQDLYSESESMDQYSTSSSEDHSSDIEWPYNMGSQRQLLDCSDDSISDEESLIEIAIPSGQFLSPEKDPKFNLKCCKLSAHEQAMFHKDFFNEMNEEDNLIEIDIYMGSIKCSSFDI